MTETLDTMNLGIEVPIGSIEKELKKLWDADDARTNASLMNFVIFSEEKDALVKNSDIMRDLTEEHACRGLLINLRRGESEVNSRAWITAHCHLANGQKSICCEQIAFQLNGYSSGRLRNVVFAHASGDLPLVVWWQGELSEVFLERFYSVVDRFIFDSSQWSDPVRDFEKINEALECSTNKLVIQDLSWTRTYHYRLAVAALFDEPCAQLGVDGISEVVVTAHPEHRLSALMLIAWLFTQLKYKFESMEGDSIIYSAGEGREVKVTLVLDQASAPIGELGIFFDQFKVRIKRERGCSTLLQTVEGELSMEERIAPADGDEQKELVADQLSRGGKNSLFRKIFPEFRKLI